MSAPGGIKNLRRFIDSLPPRYRDKYGADVARDHYAASLELIDRIGIKTFSSPQEGTAVCVVAPDRPGLLASMSAAFLYSGLEVLGAEAYTHNSEDGRAQAVDLFWLKRRSNSLSTDAIGNEDFEMVRRTLIELLAGKINPKELKAAASAPATGDTLVRFLEDERGYLSVLEVETDDRAGLLMTLTQSLFENQVQITGSEVHTQGLRVLDRFTIEEFDGTAISDLRRLQIQIAVMSAIEPLQLQASTPPPPQSSLL